MTKRIYLAGGIKDLSLKEQTEWRNNATKQLQPQFNILNPMRRNFRGTEFQSPNEIISLDKNDILNSDILLVNGKNSSWGTAMEVMFAFIEHKIIITYNEKKFEETSPWLIFHSTRICENLGEAIKYIKINF